MYRIGVLQMNAFKTTKVSAEEIGSEISYASTMVLMSNDYVAIFAKCPPLTYGSHSNLDMINFYIPENIIIVSYFFTLSNI